MFYSILKNIKSPFWSHLFHIYKIIPTITRAQLINDAFHLAQANRLDPILPLKLVEYMKSGENDYLPWHSLLSSLPFYQKIFKTNELKYDFDQYLQRLIKPIYFKLTWQNSPNDSPLTK